MNKTARIVSNDSRFARMLTIELQTLGLDVTDLPEYDSSGEFYYVIADLDSCSEDELFEFSRYSILIGFSKKNDNITREKSVICEEYFQRPFLMKDFLEIFGSNEKPRRHNANFQKNSFTKKNTYLSVSEIDKAAVWGDQIIPLSDNEFKVLSLLCDNRYELVEREKIDSILGSEDGNICDVYICHLRRKIDNKLGLKLIYTIRGKGYMLKN
jgi:hypothetical protein